MKGKIDDFLVDSRYLIVFDCLHHKIFLHHFLLRPLALQPLILLSCLPPDVNIFLLHLFKDNLFVLLVLSLVVLHAVIDSLSILQKQRN